MAKYIGIKREATFPLEVGGNTLINFQKLLLYILSDKTQEEMQLAQEKISKREWDEDWYEHVAFLSLIIRRMEQIAQEKGLAVEEELEEPPSQQEN
jgi:hypothetical protein